jgi:CRISPR system Cascade subunit CasC
MVDKNNPLRNVRVEFHVLQSFPVTCLNRDDVGAPKTAMVGGTTRARVSSQCWKRQVRLSLHELGIPGGTRTKLIKPLIEAECIRQGASKELAAKCGEKVEQVFIKGADSNKKQKTLIFLSPAEVKKIASAFAAQEFDPEKVITKKQAKEVAEIIGKPNFAVDGLDIALFGRMVAQAATMNVEAAASFAHAISTHRVTNEVEFFTALDDEEVRKGITSSAHMGSLEFNSATYYRYVSLDLGQLHANLAGQGITESVAAFIKALYSAIPAARQASQSGACWWDYARVYVRRGQRLQVPFETAVKARNGGFLEPSKEALSGYLARQEKLGGSLFGTIDAFTYGEDENFSIDRLIESVTAALAKVNAHGE